MKDTVVVVVYAHLIKENKMIFGKTYRQQNEKRAICSWFAWHPVKFQNGQWCWWQQVTRIPRGSKDVVWYEYTESKGE